jgi:hypothetical protein
MTNRIAQAVLLLMASFAPVSVSAGTIELSDVRISARATFSAQRVPEISDFDVKVAPADQLLQAAQALVIEGLPFPNVPNSQNAGFASSAGVVGGVFGVGVNGLHFQNSLPPNRYFASGTWSQTLTNNSDVTQVSTGAISVPAPTIRFFGVGNSFPPGADPDLDASAAVNIRLTSKLTHANGSVVDTVHFEYGMHTLRAPIVGVTPGRPDRRALGALSRFDEPDGSFGFRCCLWSGVSRSPVSARARVWSFGYDYFATASTGFGETAQSSPPSAIRFISTRAAVVSSSVGDAQPDSVPEPGSNNVRHRLAVLGIFAHRHRFAGPLLDLKRQRKNSVSREARNCKEKRFSMSCIQPVFFTLRAFGSAEPGMTRVKSSLRIEGHHMVSMCSITNSVPRA